MTHQPKIAVLSTGGTIAGKAADSSDTTGYKPGEAFVDNLLVAVPQLRKVASIVSEQISNIGSEDMTDDIWIKLANAV